MTMSWAINRVGQKIQCIQHHDAWSFCSGLTSRPLLGEIYIAASFATIDDYPGVFLREVAAINCSCYGLACAPWPLFIFRPVNERPTSIEVFAKILDRTPVPAS
jgi:hypothetical protein